MLIARFVVLMFSIATSAPGVGVVTLSLPVKSVKELIALAKAKPGTLNYSTGSTGSSSHLSPELFKAMTGVITDPREFLH